MKKKMFIPTTSTHLGSSVWQGNLDHYYTRQVGTSVFVWSLFPPISPYRNLVLALKLYCNPAVVFCLQQSLPDAVQNCATAVRKQPDRVLFTHAPLWNLAGNFEMKRAESDLPGWKRLSLHPTMYSCFFLLRGRNTENDDTCKSQLTAEWLTYLSSRSSTN